MELKRYLQDEGLVRFGKVLGKKMSYRGIHRLAKGVAGLVNILPNNKMRQVIKENLSVVMGKDAHSKTVDATSKEIIRNLFGTLADYHYYYQHPEECNDAISLSPNILEMIADIKERNIPTIICGPHHGNFDLFGFILARQKLPMMVLSVPNPEGVYNEQNKMRNESGMNVVPIDMKALRDAKKFLLEGNCLATGIERRVEDPQNAKYKPLFFGKPAALPVFYTRFGLEEGVRTRMGYCIKQEDGRYYVDCTDPIPMRRYPDLKDEYELNAQAVLKEAEKVISQDPGQWLMLHLVWDEKV